MREARRRVRCDMIRDAKGRAHFGRWEHAIHVLVVISLVGFAFETLPNQPQRYYAVLGVLEAVTVAIFTLEYLLRCFLSRPRRSYVFSFFGIIDLVAILPFYLSTGIDLRSVRAFRLLRVLRIFKLARYNAAVDRFRRAFVMVREELALFGATALIVLYLASVGIYYFEKDAQPEVFSSVFESLWWAVCTLTTVGYGDAYPVTVGGKLFTCFVVVTALGIVAVPTGLFASALTKVRQDDAAGGK
jgi:voltage-gated potassium channel